MRDLSPNSLEALVRSSISGECGENAAWYQGLVPARKTPATIGFAVSLDTLPSERGVRIVATPLDGREQLVTRQAELVCTMWLEGAATVRGKIAHTSGVVAYFQGTDALIELARALSLRIEVVPEP